ncbi:radical SAM protein [Vibrio mimicus]
MFQSKNIRTEEFELYEIISIIEKISPCTKIGCSVNIFGGEPYCYYKLNEFVEYLTNSGFNVGLTTNATSSINSIRETIHFGLKRLSVDLTSISKEKHEQLKPKTFDQTIKLLNLIQSEEVSKNVNVIIHNENYYEVCDILYMLMEFDIENVSLYSMTNIGNALSSSLYPVDYKTWLQLKNDVNNWVNNYSPKFSIIWENTYLSSPTLANKKICSSACSDTIDIRSDGKVYYCCLLMALDSPLTKVEGLSLGCLKSATLDDINLNRKIKTIDRNELCPAMKLASIDSRFKQNYWCPYDWEFIHLGDNKKYGYIQVAHA